MCSVYQNISRVIKFFRGINITVLRSAEFRVQSSEFRTQSSEFRVQPGLDNQVLPGCRPFWNLLEACLYFVTTGSHEIERRSRQGSVQSSEWPLEGVPVQRGLNPLSTIQRSEFRGWLWRRRGKRGGVNPEFRVQLASQLD